MHVTIVSAVPLYSGTAVLATRRRELGESAATVTPHRITAGINNTIGK